MAISPAGQMVSFDAIEGPKGLHAANIKPLSNGETTISDEEAATAAVANGEDTSAD